MKRYLITFIIALSTVPVTNVSAQVITSERVDTFTFRGKTHSPIRAAMLSAAIPGMGQAYNHKYWKVPLVYAGAGTLIYFIRYNNDEYKFFRQAFYDAKIGRYYNSELIDRYPLRYADNVVTEDEINNLEREKDRWRKYRDYNILGLGALYLINIIDAHIDAYFLNFDVGKDLTVQLNPLVDKTLLSDNIFGLKLSLDF